MFALLSVLFAVVPLLVCYGARAFLGRDLLQPLWLFPLLFLAGAGGGVLFGTVLSPNLALWFGAFFEVADARLVNAAVVVPVAEELGKGLVLLAFLPSRWFRSPVDGLLYGLAAGAGFATVENVLSFVAAYEWGGGGTWAGTVLVRLPAAVLVHGGGTAVLGLYLGAARWSQRGWVVFGALPAALFVAASIHGGWNLLVELGGARGSAGYYVAAAVLLCVLAGGLGVALWASLRVEAADLRVELAGEVAAGRVDGSAVSAIARMRVRGRGAERVLAKRLRREEAILVALAFALRRLRLEGRGEDEVARLRAALRDG